MSENKAIKIRTKNGTQTVNIDLNQDFDYLEVLSLKILQKDAYRLFCSPYGVLVGKVLANGGFPIKNAKLSIFIPLDAEDSQNTQVLEVYPFTTPQGTLVSGKRYNLLPRDVQYNTPVTHTPVGTFPSKYDIMTNQTLKYVHEKYYKYTTTTNENGDYMFFGVPSGTHIIHMDIDLSDIGTNSVTPADLINLGYSPYLFESNTKFRSSNDLDQLAQIVGQNQTTFINPFWGDPDQCSFGITRLDFNTSRFVYPKGYLIGSIYTDAPPEEPNSFIPRSCWQKDMNAASTPDGFKGGVSRIVNANKLRTPREVANNGEVFGHKGIIEAVRINEDTREPEYVGKWETNADGSFLIPLPLNRGKKVWDEDEQSWVDSETDGFFTYADYRFKIYFHGQGDSGPGGLPEYQFDGYDSYETELTDDGDSIIRYNHTFSKMSKTNRGVLFLPNDNIWEPSSNAYAFHAKPTWRSAGSYEYNMEDQFGNQIDVFRNYARIRLGSYFTTEQFFNLKSDFDSALRGIDEYQGKGAKWYNGTNDQLYGDLSPEWHYWSIGTNPWIITQSYVPPNEGRNQFPTNYLFTAPYLAKAPTKQPVYTEVPASIYGGFVSNYLNSPKVEATFGPAFGEIRDSSSGWPNTIGPEDYAFSPSPNWTANAGGVDCSGAGVSCNCGQTCGDCCCQYEDGSSPQSSAGGTRVDWGGGIDMTGDKNTVFSDTNYGGCAGGGAGDGGCLNMNTFSNGGEEGIFNEDTGPYDYNFQTPGSDDWSDIQVVDPNNGLNGNAGFGGFIAPVAGIYRIKTQIAYCGAATTYWASVGFSICDTTSTDCSSDGNWSYSGRTTVMGKTEKAKQKSDWIDFDNSNAYPWYNTQFNKGSGLEGWQKQNGMMTWELPMKEGQAIKLHVRASKSDTATSWDSNANSSAPDLTIIHWASHGPPSYDAWRTWWEVTDLVDYLGKYDTTNRETNQGITGSLYFPQYYLGADENQSCSRANGDFISAGDVSERARQNNWKHNSLLVTGSWIEGGNYDDILVESWGNDPKSGLPIPNSKYYNIKTIGQTDIVEITKEIPDFRIGPNQWATIDGLLPETSADMAQDLFDVNNTDYEDFSTNSATPGDGRKFLQKKNFAPFDNLGFRNSQQYPRELGALNYNNTIGDDSLIPGYWADWWANWGNNTLQYPVQAPYYYIQNNFSESNYHYFRYSPTNSEESAGWKSWDTKIAPLWYSNNTFWWKDIFPVEHPSPGGAANNPQIPPDGPIETPWNLGSTFNVAKGHDTPMFNAYPMRKYYYFGIYPNRTPITRLKNILGL